MRRFAAVLALAVVACGGEDESGDGSAGSSGSAGSAGSSGNAGSSGSAGSSGNAGSSGSAGTAGVGGGANPYPEPDAHPPNKGPGGPTRSFGDAELFQNCAFLNGGPLDTTDHHNLVVMLDGYLLMPWAPQGGGGGLSFYEFTDPCNPTLAGAGYSATMRETHSIGFSNVNGKRYAVVNQITAADTQGAGGIQFWDVTDPLAPVAVADIEFPDFFYPDAYARVVLSVFWQGKYVFAAAGDSGLVVVDAADPMNPRIAKTYPWDPVLRAGQVQAIGSLLVVTAASIGRTALLDITNPESPQPIPGGEFSAGGLGVHYFSNFSAGNIYYTTNFSISGGLMVYDIKNPSAPTQIGSISTSGAGGYVFVKDQYAFTGESDFFVIFDISDHANITEAGRLGLQGDQDTMTPIGNMAVLSVDDDAPPQGGTAIAPWTKEPDTLGPHVTWTWPSDGATGASRASIGLTFSEMIDVNSAWTGSVRIYQTGTAPGDTRVDGDINVQENIVNFTPLAPLSPNTSYTIEIPAGGIADYNGNRTTEPFIATFTTGG